MSELDTCVFCNLEYGMRTEANVLSVTPVKKVTILFLLHVRGPLLHGTFGKPMTSSFKGHVMIMRVFTYGM